LVEFDFIPVSGQGHGVSGHRHHRSRRHFLGRYLGL